MGEKLTTDMTVILQEFEGYYKKWLKHTEKNPVRRERKGLRVSSFPYCGLRDIYERWLDIPETVEFGSLYYTSVGTLVHMLVQAFVGKGGRIYGNWKCKAKVDGIACTGKRWFSAREKCPKCGTQMEYVEFHVKEFKVTSGHLDGVYQSQDGRYFLIDYKTSSTRVIKTNGTTGLLPYNSNVAQIRAYCALIELHYDIKISGWILMYVARDNPMITYKATGSFVTDREKEKILKNIERWDRHYGIVEEVKKFKDIGILIEEKPCKTKEFYDLYYSDIDGCPLAANGICFDQKMLMPTLKNGYHLSKL